MKRIQNILNQITNSSTKIKTNYPVFYKLLNETPITIPSINHPDININNMQQYLESLKQLLKHHIETKKKLYS